MNLSDARVLRDFLSRHGLTARKGLGQHFLCSSRVVDAICNAVIDCKGILEIGPGPGVLTSRLSEQATLSALELDPTMIVALAESAPKATVIQGDVLKTDLAPLLAALPEPRAIVSNIPYYITGPILTAVANQKQLIAKSVLMMQREVAERITAPPGSSDRGSLSVFLQANFDLKKIASVPPGAFIPPPKVDSTVLLLTPKPDTFEEAFFAFVRDGFTQPRKTLANNLSSSNRLPRVQVENWLNEHKLDPRTRAQMLTLPQWQALWNLKQL